MSGFDPSVTPDEPPIGAAGWGRALARGLVLALITFGSLGVLLLVRLIERPVWGQHRPWTPFITQFVCRAAFVVLGMKHEVRGRLMRQKGGLVANHSSWLDIFALNARARIYFVSKSEVAAWPFIGWLARATGTVFIRRAARDAKLQQEIFESRLKQGHKLMFFPEGTSTDSLVILPFKSTLFAAFFTPELREILWVQPVTTIYRAPAGEDARFYGWWGDMEFAPHLLKTLAARRQGSVEIIYHAPLKVSDFADRKALAKACEAQVRAGRT
jgi:lyso-ornithine lipid O-acyltransferase